MTDTTTGMKKSTTKRTASTGARKSSRSDAEGVPDDDGTNEVRLRGRLTSTPVVVDLPSGDSLVSFRISVPRGPGSARTTAGSSSQRVDSIPCSAWTASLRRRIAGWRPGDTVEVTGAVCCRFYQAGGATRSRVEVVASSAKIIRRAPGA
ncbi:MAG TPA: single-stranded DNA-binding protein [Nocardioides sp.]|nr:single-stranded DNA-binding protein [Nocardioides sp.]